MCIYYICALRMLTSLDRDKSQNFLSGSRIKFLEVKYREMTLGYRTLHYTLWTTQSMWLPDPEHTRKGIGKGTWIYIVPVLVYKCLLTTAHNYIVFSSIINCLKSIFMRLLGQTNNWRHNVLNLSACPFFRMSPNLRTQYSETNKPILTPIGTSCPSVRAWNDQF